MTTLEIKNTIINKYIRSKAGLAKLAASMVKPLTEQLGYSSIARHILKRGVVRGGDPTRLTRTSPMVELNAENRKNLYQMFDKVLCVAKSGLLAFEDDRFFSMVDSRRVKPTMVEESDLTVDFFNLLFKKFEYGKMVMNIQGYTIVRKRLRGNIDITCNKAVQATGLMASINGSHVFVKRACPRNRIYLFAKDAGRMKISPLKVTIESVIEEKTPFLKFNFTERVKMALNPKALKVIEITGKI